MSNSYNYSHRKLTFEQAENIRKEYTTTTTSHNKLARKYNLSNSTIQRLLKYQAYTHPTPGHILHEEAIP